MELKINGLEFTVGGVETIELDGDTLYPKDTTPPVDPPVDPTSNFRVAIINIRNGFYDSNAEKMAGQKDSFALAVARIDAGVIMLQEQDAWLSSTHSNQSDYDYLQNTYGLAGDGSYPYIVRQPRGQDQTPPVTSYIGIYENIIMSKYPISDVDAVWYAKPRQPIYAEIDLGGENKIGVMGFHLDTGQGDINKEKYNRCVQMHEIIDFMNKKKIAKPYLKGFVIGGDHNATLNYSPQEVSYSSRPTGSGHMALPDSVTMPTPLYNSSFPEKPTERYNGTMTLISDAKDGNGDTGSYLDGNTGELRVGVPIDYLHYTDAIVHVGEGEVLNSGEVVPLDNNDPLRRPKFGVPLPIGTSHKMSDHVLQFSDFLIPG